MVLRSLFIYLFMLNAFAIVGGEVVTGNKFDSVVAFVRLGKPFCTGVAIGPRFILTAAHCFENKNLQSISVYVGNGKKLMPATRDALNAQYRIDDIILHPSLKFQYPGGPLKGLGQVDVNDIALVKLSNRLVFDEYFPILSSPTEIKDSISIGTKTLAVGFGYTGEADFLEPVTSISYGQKRKAVIPIYETNFHEIDMRNSKTDTCYVDSGGPVFVRVGDKLKVAAIVSASHGFCAEGKYATLYSLAYDSLCWISKVTHMKFPNKSFHCTRNWRIKRECFSKGYSDNSPVTKMQCANNLSEELFLDFIK